MEIQKLSRRRRVPDRPRALISTRRMGQKPLLKTRSGKAFKATKTPKKLLRW